METYQGQINEFINWITGVDSRSNLNTTQGLPVSGKAIRELIQNHLLKPFIKYDDVSGGQYIFFSSEEAKNEWLILTDPNNARFDLEKASTIPITTMTRPSDTAIEVKSLDISNNEGDISDSRYAIAGDINSEAANIRYIVRMSKEQGGRIQPTVDAFTVTYAIKDATGNERTFVEDYNSDRLSNNEIHPIEFPCYSYLKEGKNSVKITVQAKNSAASFESDISVYLIRFTLESSYDFSKAISPNGNLNIPVTITRSVSGLIMNIYAQIEDGNAINKVFETVANPSTNSPDNPYTTTLEIRNTYGSNSENADHIKHTLRLYATLGAGGSATQFTSNIIYYTFETASDITNIVNKFINIKYNTPANKDYIDSQGNIILFANQYEEFSLDWSYYTDHLNIDTSIDVSWYLRYKDGNEYKEMLVGNDYGAKGSTKTLVFTPEIYQTQEDGATLIAKYTKNNIETEIDSFPIIIAKSNYDIQEASETKLKLSASGKSNTAATRDSWVDPISGSTTTFSNMSWDDRSGWINNSLQVQGVGTTAVINYCPIPSNYPLEGQGKTIEIEFIPVKSDSDNDVLIRIGDNVAGHIDIKPTGAYLYLGVNEIIHTNYKVGERIKLAFVFNTSNNTDLYANNLVYIINNGILERARGFGLAVSYGSDNGNITIGGTNSIVKVFTIRAYDKALTYQQELNNFIFDSLDKTQIISRNQLFENGQLAEGLVANKIDTILIEGLPGQSEQGESYGGLTDILTSGTAKEDSETTVNIKRTCISNPNYPFYIMKSMIRKHGQSTINYPITSLKFWFNKSATVGDNPSWAPGAGGLSDSQRALNLNKNRYVMKDRAVPANKFVLQANYADSSGVHNGGLLRLINDTWYNANFGTRENPIYRLRTDPQLFTSGYTLTHNNANINEDGYVEGLYNITQETKGYDASKVGKTWPQITGKAFPYQIRISADSFPCAVFYNDPSGDGETHFLGQYVFMDDKKSDFIYGERSIYSFGDNSDPFVMNIDNTKNGVNGKQDIAENRVWNNKNVLQIEIVLPNTSVTSYLSMQVPTAMELDDEGNIISTGGTMVDCRQIKYDQQGNPLKYYWEDYFEMIYPDPDDIEEGKFNVDSEFNQKAQSFIDFLQWITGISALNVNGQGVQYTDGTVNQTALDEFKRTAAQHLDLYKLAAYYIFFLRFGLVDSVERNAQLKTYDGVHFHYEPWDMDIALGNTNQGALVLNPPLTRDSVIPGTSTKAFSGRGANTSNFMWDCLEAWDYWMNTLVPQVAEALFNAGLNYENVSAMFDDNYSNKWAESLYNEAGFFKYIKNGGGDYLPWLQGSRISHRHWWLSTSMNYYDAKWSCGTFKDKRVVLFVEKGTSAQGTDILTIKPTSDTFFEITSNTGTASVDRKEATPSNPAIFDISANGFSAKDPTWIYGGLFIEELDLSCFAKTMSAVDVSRCYDDVLGANIKSLNIGVPLTTVNSTQKTGSISGTQLRITAVSKPDNNDALGELITLDVTGQATIGNTQELFVGEDRTSIENFYASGTALSEFQNAPSGNSFNNLVLPASTSVMNADNTTSVSNLNSFVMHNASWNNLEFWNTSATSVATIALDENNEPIYIEDEEGNQVPVYVPASATYTKLSEIPSTINVVVFDGSTARNECSLRFLLDWIESIKKTLNSYDNGSYDSDELHNVLKTKSFRAENINWNASMGIKLNYSDLENIAYINGISQSGVFNNNLNKYIKGYVVLNGTLDATQMVEIKKWFGDSAFDKSGINSQLVVDSTSDNVIINIDGVTIENGTMILEEGSEASMTGTKFLLRDSVGNNKVMEDMSAPEVDEYIWSIGPTDNSMWGASYQSCKLEYSESDGRMKLIAQEGDFGDYDVKIRVAYRSDDNLVNYSYITVHIIGVVYPTGYSITATGENNIFRPFYASNTTKSQYFPGNTVYNQENVESYVLYTGGQILKIKIEPVGTYNAKIKDIQFSITKLFPSEQNISNGYNSIPATANDADVFSDSDDYLIYNASYGTNHTMEVRAASVLPDSIYSYNIKLRVKAGARDWQTKSINVMVVKDDNIVVGANSNNGLYMSLITKYNTDYGLTNNYPNLYKTHLLGIEESVDFTTYANSTTSLETNRGDSILLYLPNVTELNFEGCRITGNASTLFNFTNCTKLTTLSVKDCSQSDFVGTINLTGALQLNSLDMRGTTLNVNIPENSRIVTLKLGTPTSVIINSPTVLIPDNVTIQSSSNLATITLTGVNQAGPCGYSMFNKIYS